MLRALAKRMLRSRNLELSRLLDADDRFLEARLSKVRPGMATMPGIIVEAEIDGRSIRFFVTDERDHIQKHHRSGRFYEQEVLERISALFRGGTFVDVGANVGNHALYAAIFLGAEKVIAFEPIPSTALVLDVNVALNRLGGLIETQQVGLASAEGNASFTTPRGNIGATRLHPGVEGGEIRIARGDDVLAGQRVDFIKIDAEGMEIDVLEGLRETIARERPGLLVEVEVESNERAFFAFLESVGYRIEGDPLIDDDCANHFAVPAAKMTGAR